MCQVAVSIVVLSRMVQRSADKRPSATEALTFPVVAQPLDVRFFHSTDV